VEPTRLLAGEELDRFAAGASVTTDAEPLTPPPPPSHLGSWGV
jgi:hypothetical protein